jgi:hypothetical protein
VPPFSARPRAAHRFDTVRPPGRRLLGTGVVLLLATALVGVPPAAAEPVGEQGGDLERVGVTEALAAAREYGKPVRIADQTSATSESFALPTGEIEATVSAGVVRMRQDGDWVPVDLTLRRAADGAVEPVAHPAGLELTGRRSAQAGELASLATAAGRVSMGWDGALPEPVLSGNRATYPEVKPGVDLIVDATREGFEQFMVLKTPAAVEHVDELSLPLSGAGVVGVAEDPDGGLELTDRTGKVVAVAPTPLMWDARTTANGETPARSAPIALEAGDTAGPRPGASDAEVTLTLSPDKAWLKDPATRYPVTIDPQINKLLTYFDTTVMEGIAADRGGANFLQLGATTEAKPKRARSFVKWNTAVLRGKQITASRAYFYNWYSTTCTATPWEIWTTAAADGDTRWSNQPKWLRKEATSTETKGLNSTCGDGWVSIDAKRFFQYASDNNQTYANMGIRASNEADKKQWKEFRSRNAADTAQVPYAKVTYTDKPVETSTYEMRFSLADPDQALPGAADRNAATTQAWADSRQEWSSVSGSLGESEASILSRSDTTDASFLAAQQEPATDLPTYEVEVEDENLDSFEPEPEPDSDFDLVPAPQETAPASSETPGAPQAPTAAQAGARALSAVADPGPPETDTPPDSSEWLTEPEADPEYEVDAQGDRSASAVRKKPHEDWMTTKECRTGWRKIRPRTDAWYYKNKFSFCQVTSAVIVFTKCTGPRCEYSDVMFNIMYIGAGSHTKRAVNWNAYIYDWTQVNKPDLTVPITVDVRCRAFLDARCYRKGAAVRKSLAAWKAVPKFSDVYTTKAFKPTNGDPKFKEKRSFHQFTPVHSDPVHNTVNRGLATNVRCDLAKYLGRKTAGGCIGQDVISTFVLDYKSKKYTESVEFVWQAMFRLSHLDSAKAGKYVPGGAYAQPMTGRWEYLSRDYWSSIRHNRNKVRAECRRLYGANYTDGGNDCDEYPFAATFQSANRVPSSWDPNATFAVKAVNARHNSSSGNALVTFYNRDHMLHGDPFYVSIRNGPRV